MSNRTVGVERIAKLLSILGIELMMPIIKRLPRDVIIEIHEYLDKNKNLTKHEAVELLAEFNAITDILVDHESGTDSLLTEYDEAKMAESPEGAQKRMFVGFMKLDEQPIEKIFEIVKNEDPLYQVVILRQLSESKGQDIFKMMPIEAKKAFVLEAQTSEEIPTKVLTEISNYIENKLDEMLAVKRTNFDSAISFASTLNEDMLNELLESLPEDTAEIIRANSLTFGDILAQEKRTLQKVFANFTGSAIAAAVCNLDESALEKVYACITATKRDEVEYNIGNMDVNDAKRIGDAQRQIVLEAKNLRNSGEIEIIK